MRTAIVDLQYGDTGKGRVSAYFKDEYDWYVRFNGGPNAGHTVYKDNIRYALHHLPSGALFNKKVALDCGVVINPTKLEKECNEAKMDFRNLYISESANIITANHIQRDSEGSSIGSTKQGIAYAYADKVLRKGIRAEHYYRTSYYYNLYKGLPPIAPNESAIYEGAQGIMLDVDYGHYPYVTSSSVMPSSAHRIEKVIGVMKAYTTRVGDGPPYLPEIKELVEKGKEYGTTTGRARRCFWAILDELKYAISIVQPDEIVVTKMDILKGMHIKVWNNKRELSIGNLDNYKEFLIKTFPKIKYFSYSPKEDMEKV